VDNIQTPTFYNGLSNYSSKISQKMHENSFFYRLFNHLSKDVKLVKRKTHRKYYHKLKVLTIALGNFVILINHQ